MFHYMGKLLASRKIGARAKLDGVLLLLVYAMPFLFGLALLDSMALFFMGQMNIMAGWWVLLFLGVYNGYGNFAPFYEICAAQTIDGTRHEMKMLPLMVFNFYFYILNISLGVLDAIGDTVLASRKVKWDKTERFNKGQQGQAGDVAGAGLGGLRPAPVGASAGGGLRPAAAAAGAAGGFGGAHSAAHAGGGHGGGLHLAPAARAAGQLAAHHASSQPEAIGGAHFAAQHHAGGLHSASAAGPLAGLDDDVLGAGLPGSAMRGHYHGQHHSMQGSTSASYHHVDGSYHHPQHAAADGLAKPGAVQEPAA